MILQKWDFDKHEYLPYEVPDDRVVVLYSQDMDLPIDCTNCGLHMTYSKGLTSRTIHNHVGFGYPVCQGCYDVEWEAEKAAKA